VSSVADRNGAGHCTLEDEARAERAIQSAPSATAEAPPAESEPYRRITRRPDLDRLDLEQLPAAAPQLLLDRVGVYAAHSLGVPRRNKGRNALPDAALGQYRRPRQAETAEIIRTTDSKENQLKIMTTSAPQAP
jgi:hypothetical protein